MAKAKADMDKEQKGEAQEAQAEADDLKKEVWILCHLPQFVTCCQKQLLH